ncbi:MAG TPA: cupredoxin domain-containing protein, partial [Acidimicrobiales bacterium]|nr:cupredoxin domain-containing protein [Acidimicrobiales bacterium]
TVAVCVLILGIAISRLLLSLSKDFAPLIAIVIAFAILGVAFLLSTMENIGRQALATLAVLTGVLVVGAGVAGAVKGERAHASEAGSNVEIPIIARANGFNTNQLALPAGTPAVIHLRNDSDQPQNFSIYNHKGGTALATGETVEPGKDGKVSWTTPSNGNGTYYFQSDSNPDQYWGAITIVKSETTAPGQAPAGGGAQSNTTTTAKG